MGASEHFIVETIRSITGKKVPKKYHASVQLMQVEWDKSGLPYEELRHAAVMAFTKHDVIDPYRYFFGIAWRMLSRTWRGSQFETVSRYGHYPWS